jgi:sensor histidine kinase regulating citrate/malate metabolism
MMLIVTDNGIGIDLNKHGDKLFGLNNTFHNRPDVKGVGLYLTKTQVEALGDQFPHKVK